MSLISELRDRRRLAHERHASPGPTRPPQRREVTTSQSPPPVAVNGWNSKEETVSCHNK